MTTNGGGLLLILGSRDLQGLGQLAVASSLSPTETGLQLQRLIDQGFITADDEAGLIVYHLKPKESRPDELDPHERILLVEDDVQLRELVTTILEEDGYTVIAAAAPADASAILAYVAFDLVITDGFSRTGAATLVNAADVVRMAGVTPVALFTAHNLEPADALKAGFRDLIVKPFDIDTLESQVQALLN